MRAAQDALARRPTSSPTQQPTGQPTLINLRDVVINQPPTNQVNANQLNPPPSSHGPTHQPTGDATSRPTAPPTLQPTARQIDAGRQPGPDRGTANQGEGLTPTRSWLNTPPTPTSTLKPETARPTRSAAADALHPPSGSVPIAARVGPADQPTTGGGDGIDHGRTTPTDATDSPDNNPKQPSSGGAVSLAPLEGELGRPAPTTPTRAPSSRAQNSGTTPPVSQIGGERPSGRVSPTVAPTRRLVLEPVPTSAPTGAPTDLRIHPIEPSAVTSQPTKQIVGGGGVNANGANLPTASDPPTPLVVLGTPSATIPPTFAAQGGIPDPHAPTTPPPIDNITSEMTEPTPGAQNEPSPGGGDTGVNTEPTPEDTGGLGQNRPSSGQPSSNPPGLPGFETPPEPSDQTGGEIVPGGGHLGPGSVRNPLPIANSGGSTSGNSGNGNGNEPLARPRSPVAITLRQGGRNGIYRTPQIKTDGTANQLNEDEDPSLEPTDDAELQNQRGLSGGAIAGIVIGALVGVAALAAIAALAINAIASTPPSAPTAFSDEEVYYQLV